MLTTERRMPIRRVLLFAAAALAALMAGCASLPTLEGRTETTALADTAGTRIGRALAPDLAANPGKTGIHPLPEGNAAFAARVLFAAAAEKSIDAQYYIWHGDQVGYLLFEALWHAAERGVRVRLLLDDLNTGGLDPTIAALDAHPNIEVRLYNPLVQRGARMLNFLTDFERVNRRMHNKSFTVDNQVSIVGGRNIANEYFGAGSGVVLRRSRRDRRRRGRARGVEGVRSLLEQSVRLSGGELRRRPRAGRRRKPRGQVRLDACRSGLRRLRRGGAHDRPRARSAWPPARAGMDARPGGVRRSGQDARHERPDRCSPLPGARADDRSAGEEPSISSPRTSCPATRAPRRW